MHFQWLSQTYIVYPIVHTRLYTPRPISHTLYRMGVFWEGRVILIVFPKYISLNLKSVTVGKIWLQKIQINHKKLKFYNRFFRFLELLWMYINIRIGPKHTNITIWIHMKEILKNDKFERGSNSIQIEI